MQQNFIEMQADIHKLKSDLERKIEEDKQHFAELQTQILNLMQTSFPKGTPASTLMEYKLTV